MKSLAAVSTVLLAAVVILASCSMSQDLYDYHQRSLTDSEDSIGIAIDVGDGLVTREDPATPLTDIFYVKLKGQPSGDVMLGTIQSLSLDEVDVTPASLTFTQSNWNIEQAITVTGVDDGIADNVQIAVIDLGTLSGGGYDNYDPGDVTVQNLDDETAGSPAVILMNDGLVTDESGGLNDFFSIVLNDPPVANVSVGTIVSTDTGEITLSPSSLTFTTANWNSPQNVNLNGVNDAVFDGIQMVTINLGSTTSADPNWDGIALGSVTAYNLDDDGPKGITVLAGTTNYVGEGTVSQFEVVLDAQPSADVTINVSSDNVPEATVAPTSLIFTSGNWNTPQTLTVTGVNDAEADGPQTCSINLSNANSSDTEYSGMVPTPNSVPYDVLDDDSAGITVNAAPTLTVSESATSQSFTVVLNSQPVADVDIAVSSSDTGEGIITAPGGGMLTFTTGNWNVPQSVTVEGVDDGLVDGNQPFAVVLGAAASSDSGYNGMNPGDVSCITTDDESNKDILVLAGPSSLVSENGGSSEFEVVLTAAPTANVTFSVSSGDTTEGTVSTPSLTFTTANWNIPQPVQVFGVDDAIQDNNITFFINFGSASSTDTDYNGISPAPLSFDNIDDDSVGITVSAGSFMYLSEAGTSSSFEVVLNSQPTASVTISVSSSDTTAGTVSTGLLTFTTGSWSTPQTVTVTGVDDTLEDGNQAFTVDLSASSADTDYDLLTPAPLAFETVDDDIAGVTVDIDDGLVTTETGATDTFQIVLNSEPTNSVDISLTSLDTGEATINPIGVSFSTANWFLPVTFTVTGVDDFAVDGTQPAVIDLGTVSSLDGNYNGMMPDDVTVYNVDDDSLKQVVVLANPKGYFTSENGASTQIAVVLSEQPTANVNLGPLSSTDATEGSVSPPSLTFTPADWNIPHMVTVTGVVDGGKGDGKVFYDVDLGITSSTDLLFDGIAGGSVTVTSIDSMFIDEYVWIPPTPAPFNSIGPSGSATGIPIMFREVDFQDGYVAEDEGYEVIPIGFTFYYMGWPCEQIMVFTNGFATFNMYLNTASFWNDALILSSASAPPAPDADLFIDILSPWWDDLHMGLVPGTVYFETSGIMPNRVLTIEWEDARYAVTSSNTYNFQIKLYEYSNRIEFCYGPYSGGPPNNTTASVGIKDDIGGDGHFIDGLNGAMVEAGSSFDYDYPDFPTNSMGGDVFIGFDPTL